MRLRSSKIVDLMSALKNVSPNWPYTESDFQRQDETSDSSFYDEPKLVYYVDRSAVSALTSYYESVFKQHSTHLDICSSWVSHYPTTLKTKRSIGMGMNEFELCQNKQLSEFVVQDLNIDPKIPLEDDSVDYVTCVVSIAYLVKPLEVFREVHRVLKPGGLFIVSQSIWCWPSKAINIWLQTDDMGHLSIIRDYFHFAGGFKNIEALDITKLSTVYGDDPMFIVQGMKA